MNTIYAGIGSRNTPNHTLRIMRRYASSCADKGYTLRSGGAIGADTAFARGASDVNTIIYRAHHATEEAIEMAAKYHPNWRACKDYVRMLHARNCMILLGDVWMCIRGLCYSPL